MEDDDKVSSFLSGDINRDINEIKRGKRDNIRVPQGYQMAHRRGYEARKGYGYEYSDLQITKNHKTQHKYDYNGKKR
ncbi:polymorphic toxin type 8 domain-containing protein [Paenibacillus oryzisoli]|uniref:polymorphic toxin type 8 domain-containing protein n=1 Tax=Paenibacillus oryzisoli TaxID=1850517 RepID=UPI0023D95D02|nr:polymorphic toxin type 8 domain-containing protein [Paenibacillus oryzisoli]